MASSKFTRRGFLASVGVGTVGILLAACAGPAPTPTTAPVQPTQAAAAPTAAPTVAPTIAAKPTTSGAAISLKLMSWDAQDTILDGALAAFDSKQGTKTEYVYTPSANYQEKILTMLAGGVPPDVMLLGVTDPPAYSQRNQIVDLGPLISRDNYDLTDFFPQALELGRWQGKLWGVGDNFVFKILFYNTALFDEAGVAKPPAKWSDPAWTFDKFVEAATKLTKKVAGQKPTQYGFATGSGQVSGLPWIWSNGGDFLDSELSKVLLTQAPAVEALQLRQDLSYKYGVAPTPDSLATESLSKMAAGGKVAMWWDGPWTMAALRKAEGLKWDIAPIPAGKKGQFSCAEGAIWSIATQSKFQDKAWELHKQLISHDGELTMIKRFGFPGSRKSVTMSQDFLGIHPPEHANVISEGGDFALPLVRVLNWREIDKVWTDDLAYLINNEKTGQEVAQLLSDTITPMLAQAKP